jgi:hypothetical protein
MEKFETLQLSVYVPCYPDLAFIFMSSHSQHPLNFCLFSKTIVSELPPSLRLPIQIVVPPLKHQIILKCSEHEQRMSKRSSPCPTSSQSFQDFTGTGGADCN